MLTIPGIFLNYFQIPCILLKIIFKLVSRTLKYMNALLEYIRIIMYLTGVLLEYVSILLMIPILA